MADDNYMAAPGNDNRGGSSYVEAHMDVPLMVQFKKDKQLSVSSYFKLKKEELMLFFDFENMQRPDNEGEKRQNLRILEKVGCNNGLIAKVSSDANTGIIGDEKDIERRQNFYGKNERSLPYIEPYRVQLWEALTDKFNVILMVFACVQLVVTFYSTDKYSWLQPVSVLFAVLFACIISSACDYSKLVQQRSIVTEIQKETCHIIRGSTGVSRDTLVSEVVVGDLIELSAGDRVPADCILIEEMDMFCDQSSYFEDDKKAEYHNKRAEKQCSQNNGENHLANPDICLLQGTTVLSGSGRAIVCAVGKNTLREVMLSEKSTEDRKKELCIEDDPTPEQNRLSEFGKVISTFAWISALVIFAVLMIYWLILMMVLKQPIISEKSLSLLLENFMVAVAILIVSVPEGLPLAISIAMAFSTDRLKEDHLLIKKLQALEDSGQIRYSVSGKTGVMTSGEMRCWKIQTGTLDSVNAYNPNVGEPFKNLITECIMINTDADMDIDDERFKYVPTGSAVDKAMLQLLLDNDIDVPALLQARETNNTKKLFIPFDPLRKRSLQAHLHGQDTVRIVIKGAPEVIVQKCHDCLNGNGESSNIDAAAITEEMDKLIDDPSSLNQDMIPRVSRPTEFFLRPIAYAYKDMDLGEFETKMKECNNFEKEESRHVLEENLTYLATFFLHDDPKDGINEVWKNLHDAEIQQVIISGDCKATCEKIYKHHVDVGDHGELPCKSADEFRDQMKQYGQFDDKTGEWEFNKEKRSKKEFRRYINSDANIIYRANPTDKYQLVQAIKQTGKIVAFTGDSLNDASALQTANVGFAMNKGGCSMARDAADVLILDDDVCAIQNSIRWGMNLRENIGKFVQFQLTINFCVIVIVFLGACSFGYSPFNIIQLLWINLIMDVLAAIALATETPDEEVPKAKKDKEIPIVTAAMWRQITAQIIYQLTVMIVLLYAGPAMFGIKYNMVSTPLREGSMPTYRLQHYTMLFQTFVLMSLFNMWNCRIMPSSGTEAAALDQPSQVEEDAAEIKAAKTQINRSLNIFDRCWTNWWFLIVFLGELNMTYFMTSYNWTSFMFESTPPTLAMQMTALGCALGTWLVTLCVKFIPVEKFQWIHVPESQEEANQNKYLAQANGYVEQAQHVADGQ